MPNPAHRGNDKQIAAAAAESAALMVAPENIEFLNPLVDKTEIIVLPDRSLQERFHRDGQYAQQAPGGVRAEAEQPGEPKRETSFLAGLLRFTGAVVGFLMGGPAGAALGSVVGELAGDIAAKQSNIIWLKLGRAFLYPKGAHHEEDACDRSNHCCRHPARSRCRGCRTADL
jgi:hypothetical protein